jgi:hypothetical protein
MLASRSADDPLVRGKQLDGETCEEVVVEARGDRYRLMNSPGLALGTAAGDVLAIDADGRFEVVERGRNVCIQLFVTQNIEGVEALATPEIEQLGGRLGRSAKELVYTVSIDRGFPAIEACLKRIESRFPEARW